VRGAPAPGLGDARPNVLGFAGLQREVDVRHDEARRQIEKR